MLLKIMQYAIKMVDILLLSIFLLDKLKFFSTINIFWEFIKYLGFKNYILHNKKTIFKDNYKTIWNIV